MKAALASVAVMSAAILLFFAVHDVVVWGAGISSSASRATGEFWDGLGDAVAWCIDYKAGATAVLVICLALLYVGKEPTIKSR